MSTGQAEQRNFYKGKPLRSWIRVQLVARDGSATEADLIADTGNPYSVIIGKKELTRLSQRRGAVLSTNFGILVGGWVRVVIPEIGYDFLSRAYGNDNVLASASQSHPDFQGPVGLPLLRSMQYGGDAGSFWIRPAAGVP
jgi:hypothetical protein